MKKLLFTILFTTISLSAFAQDTFVEKYTSYSMNTDNVLSEMKPIDVTFVFNEGNTTDIVIYGLSEVKRFYRTGDIKKGKTTGGYEYQLVDCIQSKTGTLTVIQLFDTAVRIFIGEDYVEYQK